MSRNLAESGSGRQVWWKSSYSGDTGGNCVEVAGLIDHMGIRDSTKPDAAQLYVGRQEWAAFVTAVRDRQL